MRVIRRRTYGNEISLCYQFSTLFVCARFVNCQHQQTFVLQTFVLPFSPVELKVISTRGRLTVIITHQIPLDTWSTKLQNDTILFSDHSTYFVLPAHCLDTPAHRHCCPEEWADERRQKIYSLAFRCYRFTLQTQNENSDIYFWLVVVCSSWWNCLKLL